MNENNIVNGYNIISKRGDGVLKCLVILKFASNDTPVFGDSKRVLVVEFQETKIDVAQGSIDLDSAHKQIVDIMEGGKEEIYRR